MNKQYNVRMTGIKSAVDAMTAASVGRSNNTGTIDVPVPGSLVSKTFSSLANIPRHKVNKLVSEARPMLGGARKCKEIWLAIQKADFRKEGLLNEANIRLVFQQKRGIIYEILRISSPQELLDVFDLGGDGVLNEDEQMLIFLTVKEKM